MKKPVKVLSIGCGTVILFFIIIFFVVMFKLYIIRVHVEDYISDTGEYILVINQIGEPKPLFGPVDCELILKKEGKRICKTRMTIDSDGTFLAPEYFIVEWHDDYVKVIVYAILGEKGHIQYSMFFDGNIERERLE